MDEDIVSGVTTSDMGHVTWIVDSGGHVTTLDWMTADAGTRVKLGIEGIRDVTRSEWSPTRVSRICVKPRHPRVTSRDDPTWHDTGQFHDTGS